VSASWQVDERRPITYLLGCMSSYRLPLLSLVVVLTLAAHGCGSEEPSGELPAAETTAADPQSPAEDTEGQDDLVELEAAGSRFDPAVQVEQIPDGAWYCDMGTVHYAAPSQGDGSCPICGMRLVQRGAAPAHGDHGHGADHNAQ